MGWSKDLNLILLKRILLFELYFQKRGSLQGGRVWEQIAKSLNDQREDKILFKISQRPVPDWFNVLKSNLAKRKREQERASCFSPKISEVDECLEAIIQRFKKRD